MPYRYRCALCATTSRPYPTRAGADAHAQRHRDARHDGDHPDGEQIIHIPREPPGRSELLAVLVFVALIAAGLLHKYG